MNRCYWFHFGLRTHLLTQYLHILRDGLRGIAGIVV